MEWSIYWFTLQKMPWLVLVGPGSWGESRLAAQNMATGFLSRESWGKGHLGVGGMGLCLSGQGIKLCHGPKGKSSQRKKCQILSEKMGRDAFSKKIGFCQSDILFAKYTQIV